ncbi:MAG: hypothetical protein AAGF97_16125, partial [Planctomycetota bacterium]
MLSSLVEEPASHSPFRMICDRCLCAILSLICAIPSLIVADLFVHSTHATHTLGFAPSRLNDATGATNLFLRWAKSYTAAMR